ncbi:HyaD/HybD family hydrogenase maturation endopeptidase [Magnetospirillum moscoviense]|uniref:Hydrogenase expression/formation protein HupD n=1 Tax=Magnetospirillum moscoviense TaxID=1437059 RepID=A0A178MGV7_9PROT|nr:HyaD/HybD family hydrogenase maturation endopeptidase [Magnetospirillum moscoviense]MBF0325197.1 HyaD/HybD family hydrogenase maturation endopeptidase [Alphaproteobacteria bacterium]OAN47921.1 hydrogenase 2 maturation endopeptidase [Magnetospirillum moscoviense]
MRVVVLGVGNILMSDEGVGVYAVTELDKLYALPDWVEVIDGGTSGMDCLDRIADADLLLIADSMRSPGKQPGDITRIADEEINAWFKTRISPHQVGLSDVLAACVFQGIAPKKVVLVGVQPASFDTAMELTPQVAAVLPQVIERLVAELVDFGVTVHAKAAA